MSEKLNAVSNFHYTAKAGMTFDELSELVGKEMKLTLQKATIMARGGGEAFNSGRVLGINPQGPFANVAIVDGLCVYNLWVTQDITKSFNFIAKAKERAAAEVIEAEKVEARAMAEKMQAELEAMQVKMDEMVAGTRAAMERADALIGKPRKKAKG